MSIAASAYQGDKNIGLCADVVRAMQNTLDNYLAQPVATVEYDTIEKGGPVHKTHDIETRRDALIYDLQTENFENDMPQTEFGWRYGLVAADVIGKMFTEATGGVHRNPYAVLRHSMAGQCREALLETAGHVGLHFREAMENVLENQDAYAHVVDVYRDSLRPKHSRHPIKDKGK
ncbi:MAG: hypothetical protein HYS81_01195 [Candidatus Aenigmatarchaeota archaeon]|nr:MAG: hypothetical protein HYS81_01195 [Candidatus Aenigmarchaeota archaeon]